MRHYGSRVRHIGAGDYSPERHLSYGLDFLGLRNEAEGGGRAEPCRAEGIRAQPSAGSWHALPPFCRALAGRGRGAWLGGREGTASPWGGGGRGGGVLRSGRGQRG